LYPFAADTSAPRHGQPRSTAHRRSARRALWTAAAVCALAGLLLLIGFASPLAAALLVAAGSTGALLMVAVQSVLAPAALAPEPIPAAAAAATDARRPDSADPAADPQDVGRGEAVGRRDELLALVSHDLRSALNAMVGWLYLARSPRADDADPDSGTRESCPRRTQTTTHVGVGGNRLHRSSGVNWAVSVMVRDR
jgi:signal transduction histidine kinase